MGFFDNLGKKVSDAGQKTIQKTKEMSDTAKLNSMIVEEEKKINSQYYNIGKLYASIHSSDCEEAFQEMVAGIQESEARIENYKKQIQDIKGVQRCVSCGAEIAKGVAFCSSCGAAVPKEEKIEVSNVLKCSNCGAQVDANSRFCAECGSPVVQAAPEAAEPVEAEPQIPVQKVCPNCGNAVEDDCAFCAECGTKIS